ncbi:MAG: hypothetical protein QOF78_3799 [Phycisphaerales bacterium]|jgi:hypothetical protein|nr:hypothetical protein [Phycisphaerales bacterium]
MIKAILILIALAIGFGGGVYFAQHNPAAAAKFSAEEQRRLVQAQLAITQKIKAKLDQMPSSDDKPPGSAGILSAKQAAAAATPEDVKQLRQETDTLEAMLRKRLDELN